MLLSLLSMGFGFTLRSVKFFNVSFTGSFLVGGYIMFLLYRIFLFPLIPSLVCSLIIAGLYLAFAYIFIFSPLIRRKGNNLILVIASFGLLIATMATIGMLFGNQATMIARHLSDISTINIFGATLNIVQILAIIFVPIIVCIFALIRAKTRFGRAVRAIEDDREVAELIGIPKEKILTIIFFLSGIVAGIVGIIEGFDVGLNPSGGLVYILPAIVASVVGGMKSFWGGILGAFILAIAQKLTVVYIGGTWEQAVPFVILIIILLVRPEGILKK